MKIYLELNQRFGYGYQARIIMPPIDSVLDDEPYTLYEAANGSEMALQEINEATGSDYKLHEILSITDEALQANSTHDLASLKFLKEMRAKDSTQADYQETDLDGERGFLISGRGVALYCFFSWKDDKMPKARAFLEAYCRLVAARGCKGGATKLFQQLDRMDVEEGARWIKRTFARHIRSGNEVIELFQNVTS